MTALVEKEIVRLERTTNGALDFSSLDQSYDHLKIYASIRNAAANATLYVYLNNDTTLTNYNSRRDSFGAITFGGVQTNDALLTASKLANSGSPAGEFSVFTIDVMFYTNTNYIKKVTSRQMYGSGAVGVHIDRQQVHWIGVTTAINRITFKDGAGGESFAIGSTVQIIGRT